MTLATGAAALSVRHYRAHSPLRRIGRGIALLLASLLFVAYVLAPIAWLVSSSFQSEHEIISKPPHWIPHEPDVAEFRRDLRRQGQDGHLRDPQGGRPGERRLHPLHRVQSAARHAQQLHRGERGGGSQSFGRACRRPTPWPRSTSAAGKASIYAILATRVIPDIALVVPFFLFIRNLGLLDSIWSLIITYLAVTVPFSVFVLVSYFESLPDELDKAARVDGCSRLQTLLRVYLPLARPSLVAVILFTFLASWNEFLLALMFTQTPASQTLPIIVASFTSDFTISFSFINAAGVLAIIPPVMLALVFERYIVAGLDRRRRQRVRAQYGPDRIQNGDQALRRRRHRSEKSRHRDKGQGVRRSAWPVGLWQIDDAQHDCRARGGH